ncbi:MAG TPA: circularly permuted type 2 ATP-grasp protein [Steroidobacteraceae bacterium]|nr:circularly permuted type 2 ATP-grasp protein [Steroidobacteraceae bacterium]
MSLSYPNPDGRFDELFATPGEPRPTWARLYSAISEASAGAIHEMREAAEQQIRDSGVTYNVYADPKGQDRPWDLDVLPLILDAQEWAQIEAGIAQRAQVLNALLADLYGPQTLMREGLIPSRLIHGHSSFLRPVHGAKLPGGIHLHVYGADLVRSPDGRWWVMADRTQAVSGAGYALENRLIVSRTFPQLYKDLRVQHLARFFATMRDSLLHFAPKGDGAPLVVLLTPGPWNETYFEHTLLSRYLGFPLVEGGDLTVRDGRVWLKTIGGLKRVHAILRRQDGSFCDPLELRSDSALGVSGLTECARRGSVLIANALGSGVLESGALLGFLPLIAERLTGQELLMPSVGTWWCGEPAALRDALTRIERLVFKPADPARPFDVIFGQDLDEPGVAEFRARLEASPESFIAQELVQMSQAPILARDEGQRVEPRCVGLRVFAVATPAGYTVMPGGLTRVAGSASARVVTMQRGGGSKDTWVRSSGHVDASFSLLRTTVTTADLVRTPAGLPSRLAENLYWLGRYAERCDDMARLLRLALSLRLQDSEDEENAQLPLTELAFETGLIRHDEDDDAFDADEALLDAALSPEHAGGLPANLKSMQQVAFHLRERMSTDNWRILNNILQELPAREEQDITAALEWLDTLITRLMTLSGFALDGMTRDVAWRFMSIGRRMERLIFQCAAVQCAFLHDGSAGLSWLLRLADSIVTYRARYMTSPEWLPVLDLIVLDASNPRSVMFSARGVLQYLDVLEQTHGPCGAELFRGHVRFLESMDRGAHLSPDSKALRDAISGLRGAALDLNDRLTQRFFNVGRAPAWATSVRA